MDALRKVYHRAVQIPLDNVEALWQELEAFETGLNRITAKKFMADLSPGHMQARTTLRQLVNHLVTLFPTPQVCVCVVFFFFSFLIVTNADLLQVNLQTGRNEIYLPPLPTFNASERTLVGKWKAYLKWEESNPLEIEEKDKAVLIARLQNVYRKAVIRMRYYTEIWCVHIVIYQDIEGDRSMPITGSWRIHGRTVSANTTRQCRFLKPG